MSSGNVNPQLLYQSLLAETDQEALHEYDVDPRVAQYALRNTEDDREVPAFNTGPTNFAAPYQDDPDITDIPEEERDKYADTLIAPPKLVEAKQVIIIDTAARDWTVQPDAYNNVQFGFNLPLSTSTSNVQVPYYFNNQMVPYDAYDMPSIVPGNPIPTQRANNKPQLMQSESLNTVQYGLLANTWGWRLVRNRITGQIVHIDQNGNDPTPDPTQFTIVYFPVYDPTESRGARIGVDVIPTSPGDVVDSFSTQEQISNVAGIRLLRATLPFRKFDSFSSNLFVGLDGSAIANSVTNLFNTFNSEPFIYLGFASLNGRYLGAGQTAQNAFTVLVQSNRQPFPANSSVYLNQYQDYYPWGNEEYKFDPPLSYLSNASLVLSNNYGVAYSHLDNAAITNIELGLDLSLGINPSTGTPYLPLGTMRFSMWRGLPTPTGYVVNSLSALSSTYSYFSVNDFRPGDELVFYQPTVSNIMNDPSCSPQILSFFQNIIACNLLITDVQIVPSLAGVGFPTIAAGLTVTATPKMTTLESAVTSIQTICSLIQSNPGTLPGILLNPYQTNLTTSTGVPIVLPPFFSQPYSIPVLNRMMQCTYAFEVTTLVPSTDGIAGTIVKELIR
jgi:hypothetical protein